MEGGQERRGPAHRKGCACAESVSGRAASVLVLELELELGQGRVGTSNKSFNREYFLGQTLGFER